MSRARLDDMAVPLSDWEAITRDVGAVRHGRDIVRVFGVDATKFLQSQLTQDVNNLAPGESRWTFLLEPKGRVDALMRVWGRLGDSEILLDVDCGSGQRVVDRLNRFRIRTSVEIETFTWDCVSLRGPRSGEATDLFHPEMASQTAWYGVTGHDLLGPSIEIPEGVRQVEMSALELQRIESSWPDMDHEFSNLVDPIPLPGEVGESIVETAVSFTKGCYTGQELVVRTKSRGNNTPRRLRRLVVKDLTVTAGDSAGPGTRVVVDGVDRGMVTSLAAHPDGYHVGLGFIQRAVDAPAVGELRWNDSGTGSERNSAVEILP